MTTTTRINSVTDLRNYIDDHMGGDATPADVDAALTAIRQDDHPAFGGDWTEYLESRDLWSMASPRLVECTCDQFGRCNGFSHNHNFSRAFGEGLLGLPVMLDSGEAGTVVDIGSNIQTKPGLSNFVYVTIQVDG